MIFSSPCIRDKMSRLKSTACKHTAGSNGSMRPRSAHAFRDRMPQPPKSIASGQLQILSEFKTTLLRYSCCVTAKIDGQKWIAHSPLITAQSTSATKANATAAATVVLLYLRELLLQQFLEHTLLEHVHAHGGHKWFAVGLLLSVSCSMTGTADKSSKSTRTGSLLHVQCRSIQCGYRCATMHELYHAQLLLVGLIQ